MSPEPIRLGALESQVMDVLWQHGPATIRETINHLGSHSAYTTIATVLGNLERKTLVRPQRGPGRSVSYAATATREQHAATLMGHALALSGDRAASIRHFVKNMPPDDIELLREYLSDNGPGAA